MERQDCNQTLINNRFYDDLNDQWYLASNHPVALLRAENKVRVPWIIKEIEKHFPRKCKILDIGCGAGMLTNALSKEDHEVTGIDLSRTSLATAKKYDPTKKVTYLWADGYDLPFEDKSFDVVCAMDLLEHVESPYLLIKEASRVLKHGGLFFFHTFNKNLFSFLLIIKGVDLFVPNAVKNMHVYSLFIKPKQLQKICEQCGMQIKTLKGFRPKLSHPAVFKMIFQRKIPEDFPFIFSKSTLTGYCGISIK